MGTAALWILMNVAIVMDWGQTRMIATEHIDLNNGRQVMVYSETFNPILGKHPHRDKVDAYFIGALLVNNGIMIALPKKYRPWYAGAVTVVETHFVVSNNQIGIKMSW